MKSIPSILLVLLALGLMYAGGSPAPAPAVATPVAAKSPLCDCKSCECVKCNCTPIADHKPLVVGPPPDVAHSDKVGIGQVQFTQPAPQVCPTIPTPKPQVCPTVPKKAAAAPAGHYEMRQMCGPGGCSVQRVWVPAATAKAPQVYAAPMQGCANGSCGRRGLFGRRR